MSSKRKRLYRVLTGIFVALCAMCSLYALVGDDVIAAKRARDYGKDLLSVCMEPDSMEVDLPPISTEPKFLVLTRALRIPGLLPSLHEWHDQLPDTQRADSRDDVDFVVCVSSRQKVTYRVCQYTHGQRIKLIRLERRATVFDPRSGRIVAFERLQGPDDAGPCPGVTDKSEKRYGSDVSYSIFHNWLETRVIPKLELTE